MVTQGWQIPLDREQSLVARAVRTRQGVKPVYVSPGHRTDLDCALRLVLDCAPRYRLPEPTRLAHTLAAVGEAEFRALIRKRGWDRTEVEP
jgi:deoxyribonuclease V